VSEEKCDITKRLRGWWEPYGGGMSGAEANTDDLIQEAADEIVRLREEVREAFRAGWLINAIPPDEHPAGPDYVWGCEEVDWQEYRQSMYAPSRPRSMPGLVSSYPKTGNHTET